jgi:hypothetical protein
MTPEAQRVAIAEACGWKYKGPPGFADPSYKAWLAPDGSSHLYPPDYLNDLNAMHEAEKFLVGSKLWNRYTDWIGKLCHYIPEIHGLRSFVNIIVTATAAQRAEAFLRTLRLWPH